MHSPTHRRAAPLQIKYSKFILQRQNLLALFFRLSHELSDQTLSLKDANLKKKFWQLLIDHLCHLHFTLLPNLQILGNKEEQFDYSKLARSINHLHSLTQKLSTLHDQYHTELPYTQNRNFFSKVGLSLTKHIELEDLIFSQTQAIISKVL